MASPLERLTGRLSNVRFSSPTTGRAACPAHGAGVKQTLSFRETGDGAVVLCCHAGCSVINDILPALGLVPSDLFPPRADHHHRGERCAFSARDVLTCLAGEVRIVALAAHDVAHGFDLSLQDARRVWVAAGRIEAGLRLAGGAA